MSLDVLLLTSDDPMYMSRYISSVLKERDDCILEIAAAPHHTSLLDVARERYQFFGPLAFTYFGLRYGLGRLWNVLPNRVESRLTGRLHSVESLADQYDVPYRVVPDVNSEEFVQHVAEMNPDLILSIACGQLVKEELLSIPEKGCVNIHGSLLPKYRGRATAFWTLYRGEEKSGVTAHYMSPKFDEGEIIIQREFPIEEGDTMDDIYEKVVEMGSDIAVDVIDQVADGSVTTSPNPAHDGEYYSIPEKEDRREFKRRGNRFFRF